MSNSLYISKLVLTDKDGRVLYSIENKRVEEAIPKIILFIEQKHSSKLARECLNIWLDELEVI